LSVKTFGKEAVITLATMANTMGRWVLLGVDDDGSAKTHHYKGEAPMEIKVSVPETVNVFGSSPTNWEKNQTYKKLHLCSLKKVVSRLDTIWAPI